MVSRGKVIAVVEDEETIREAVAVALRKEGHVPALYGDGADAWTALAGELPDLAVLDIGLPRMDGLELCRRLRSRSEALPIIFVTSREDEFDRVLGLEIGADDYLCKPFSMRELLARIKVLLRRASLLAGGSHGEAVAPQTIGSLALDGERLSASWRGMPLRLTVTEFYLLQALAARPNAVKSREQLMALAYPYRVNVSDRTIDSHVKRVRRKFQLVDPAFSGIEAVYGAGYRYLPDSR